MVSPLIKWDHSEDWFVSKFDDQNKIKSGERKLKIVLTDLDYEYIAGHTIDGKVFFYSLDLFCFFNVFSSFLLGRVLFPATAYLFIAWETLAMMKGLSHCMLNVEFEDIKFLRATSLTRDIDIELLVMIHPGTGRFEISESGTALVTGTIQAPEKTNMTDINVDTDESGGTTLKTRDFYKELRLRGYHYNGVFRSVVEARSDGLKGKVRWDMNWVAFMDCLLQIQILGKDSRSLILPTGIQRMTIDAIKHMELVKALEDSSVIDKVFDVNVSHELSIIRSGGVEIVNLQANVVSRRRPPGIPVLEYYKFVPHFPSPMLSKTDGARVLVQLALENVPTLKVKAVEVGTQLANTILPIIQEALADLPLVTAELTLLSNQSTEIDGIVVENRNLSSKTDCLFVVTSRSLHDKDFIESSVTSLKDNGFFVAREKVGFTDTNLKLPLHFKLISIINTDDEVLVLLQYNKKQLKDNLNVIKISEQDTQFKWLEKTKLALKNGPVVLFAQKEKTSGIIGLVNCLRKEPEGHKISCVFIDDDNAPAFDLQNPLYSSQLNLGLAINVLRNGRWGSYRHLKIQQNNIERPARDHCYVNALIKSDLSSLKWISGPYNYSQPEGELVKIQYASLNFRDVMLATGKLTADAYTNNRLEHDDGLGFEYSGKTKSGKRVMGMSRSAAIVKQFCVV